MSNERKTILLLDGNALLHRAWHAIPPLTRKDGTVVNAVYGFAMVIEKMLEEIKPTSMVVAWDLPGKTFRHEVFAPYKAQRVKKEQELYDQIPMIQDLLDVWKIPSISAVGFEADDVIGTLATLSEKEQLHTYVVTGDLDALQLVNERTEVLFFQKGISQTKTYDTAAVIERYGLRPDQLVDYKALRGDTSDNIPGVAGIGEKTATTLVQEFGSIEDLFSHLENVPEKFAKKLKGQKETALQSKMLVTIVKDVPIPFRFEDAQIHPADNEALLAFYRDYEFASLIRKRATATPAPPVAGSKKKVTRNDPRICVVTTVLEFFEAAKELSCESLGILVAQGQANLFGPSLAAVALSDGTTTVVYKQPTNELFAALEVILLKASQVVTSDAKSFMHLTGWDTLPYQDLMVMSYVLHPGSRAYDLASMGHEFGLSVPEMPVEFDSDKSLKQFGMITSALPQLTKLAKMRIEEIGALRIFEEIEGPLISLLYQMEHRGIEVDIKALHRFSKKLTQRLDALTGEIYTQAGHELNINSTQQLAVVLFDELGLSTAGIKKTKSGLSTAASELEKLHGAHAIVALIEEYRELAKLDSTYAQALPKLVGADGRIHTTYNQTVAATGRLSSSDPNLQNIPIRTELGNEIRKAFVAGRGKRLIAVDYSQIELRLAGVIAKDESFIRAFQDGADIHTRTAAEVFDLDEATVTKEQRRNAKAINFGILYGMGPRALSRSTSLSFSEAKVFIERYFEIHSALRAYMEETKNFAHENEYVETLFGRRRYFPEINSGVPQLVASSERMAINMPIQGTAADIMKLAMLRVDGWLKQAGLPAQLLLQVHDELVVECDTEVVDAVARGMREMMEGVASYSVPLLVDVEVGTNWGELKRWKGIDETS